MNDANGRCGCTVDRCVMKAGNASVFQVATGCNATECERLTASQVAAPA